ncbi:MAG: NAD(P)-dependent oxidoreductase [Deltaproteobacteria bacterium]|nr:NAD(P)-dependent oxidoreductase [Deltaproteobacteria bacterium]
MKILLTGATGFVGRNVLLRLLKQGTYEHIYCAVRSVDKLKAQLSEEGFETLPPQLIPLEAAAPKWEFKEIEVDHVLHSAGVIAASNRNDYFETNVGGTIRLVNRVKARRVLILSSMAAAGPCVKGQVARTENSFDVPVTWYGQSKLEMEKRLAAECSGLNYLCLRPPIILGPRDTMELALFKLVRQPFHLKPGFLKKYYSFIGVHDLIDAIFCALGSKQEWSGLSRRSFFVTHGEPITDRQWIRAVAQVSGQKGVILPVPQPCLRLLSFVVDSVPALRSAVPSMTRDRAKDLWPARWVASSEMFEKNFSWKAKQSLQDVLTSAYKWYLKKGIL